MRSRNGNKIMDFAGPAKVMNAFKAEEKALVTLLKFLHDQMWENTSILVFSDNLSLVKSFSK